MIGVDYETIDARAAAGVRESPNSPWVPRRW